MWTCQKSNSASSSSSSSSVKRELIESESTAQGKFLFFFFFPRQSCSHWEVQSERSASCIAPRAALCKPLPPFNVEIVRQLEGSLGKATFELLKIEKLFQNLRGCDQICNWQIWQMYFFLASVVKPYEMDVAFVLTGRIFSSRAPTNDSFLLWTTLLNSLSTNWLVTIRFFSIKHNFHISHLG